MKIADIEKFYREFRLSLISMILLVAVSLGILIGNGLFRLTQPDEDSQLVNAYYQAMAQQTISDRWAYIFETEEGKQQ